MNASEARTERTDPGTEGCAQPELSDISSRYLGRITMQGLFLLPGGAGGYWKLPILGRVR
jgi:hypothetical protein